MAQGIATKSAATIAIGKQTFYRQLEAPLVEAYRDATSVMVRNMMFEDAAEGIGAFIDKRQPEWKDALTSAARHMNHDRYDDAYIAGILNDVKTIAMIGASASPNRPSYFAMKYLLGKNYAVIPVNPALAGQEILGQRVVGALADVTRASTWSTSSATRRPRWRSRASACD